MVMKTLPASTKRLEEYQDRDPECAKVKAYCLTHWPEKRDIETNLIPYWEERSSLSIHDDLLLHNHQLVVPQAMYEETLTQIHEGHQGRDRCQTIAKTCVWWPSMNKDITNKIQGCSECAREARPRREPLLVTPLPEHPWQMVGTDLFELKGDTYLIVVDYFSRYSEIAKLTSTTSAAIITRLKSIFARHGIPEIIRSDNGPQYASQEFSSFARTYGFENITSSPRYPQSNGQAERTIQTVKNMLKKSSDPHLALLNYRLLPYRGVIEALLSYSWEERLGLVFHVFLVNLYLRGHIWKNFGNSMTSSKRNKEKITINVIKHIIWKLSQMIPRSG